MFGELEILVNLCRGVARYLQNMFAKESARGRKSVAIDQLVAGKTRKEASRMFFETLVCESSQAIFNFFVKKLPQI